MITISDLCEAVHEHLEKESDQDVIDLLHCFHPTAPTHTLRELVVVEIARRLENKQCLQCKGTGIIEEEVDFFRCTDCQGTGRQP